MARADVGRLVLASSMVVYGEGRYRARSTASSRPAARRRADLDAGRFEPPCPACGRQLAWRHGDRGRAAGPAQHLRRDEAGPGAPGRGLGARRPAAARSPCATTTSTGPHMPRDTPYAGVAAIFRSALEAGRAPRVFEDGGQQRDFVHVATSRRPTSRALTAAPPDAALRAYNVASGRPAHRGGHGRALADAFGGPGPGGHRRVPARRRAARRRQPGARRARARLPGAGDFADGMRAFATDPLRPAPSVTRGCGRHLHGDRQQRGQRQPEPARAAPGGTPSPASSQTMNGSQIRSVSPRTRPVRSLISIPAQRGERHHRQPDPRMPASPATAAGPGRERGGGEVGHARNRSNCRSAVARTRRRRRTRCGRTRSPRTTSSRRG